MDTAWSLLFPLGHDPPASSTLETTGSALIFPGARRSASLVSRRSIASNERGEILLVKSKQ